MWSFETTVDATESCALTLEASTVHGVVTETVQLTPADHAALTVEGPSDARLVVEAGSAVEVNLTLALTGTEDLVLALSTAGLPGGVSMGDVSGASTYSLSSLAPSLTVTLAAVAGPEATTGDHDAGLCQSRHAR